MEDKKNIDAVTMLREVYDMAKKSNDVSVMLNAAIELLHQENKQKVATFQGNKNV